LILPTRQGHLFLHRHQTDHPEEGSSLSRARLEGPQRRAFSAHPEPVEGRKEAGLTQEQLADPFVLRRTEPVEGRLEGCGLSQQYLSELESGRRNPTVVTLYEIATALGVSHVELVRED
jgi:DNA-binding XRE family transcriptional regulator